MNSVLNIVEYILISVIFYNILSLTKYPNKKVAFIPIYRYCVMLKEYRGRVYKRDYSRFFLVLVALDIVLSIYLAILISGESLLFNSLLGNKMHVYKIIIFNIIMILVGAVMEALVFLPMLKTKLYKGLYVASIFIYIYIKCYYLSLMIDLLPKVSKDGIVQPEFIKLTRVVPRYLESGYSLGMVLILFIISSVQMMKIKRGILEIKIWTPNLEEQSKRKIYLFKEKI